MRVELGALRSVVVLVALASASPALAAPPPASPPASSSSSASENEARLRFKEGVDLADAGDHEAARLKFNQAWALLKSPAILFNLARAEQLSGHLVEALGHYRQFRRLGADPKVTDGQRQRAADNIAELSKKVGQIEVTAPPGARVSVDSQPIDPNEPDPIIVTAGAHVVEGVYETKLRSIAVECPAGTVTRAKLSFEREPAATPPPPPALATTTTTSNTGDDLLTTRNVLGGSLALGALAAAGVGLGFLIDSNAKASSAKEFNAGFPTVSGACQHDPSKSCDDYKSGLHGATSSRTISIVGFAAAGLLAGGAVVTFVVWPTTDREPLRRATGLRSIRAVVATNGLGLGGDF